MTTVGVKRMQPFSSPSVALFGRCIRLSLFSTSIHDHDERNISTNLNVLESVQPSEQPDSQSIIN